MAINLRSHPRDPAGAELFGHERGAFTGAHMYSARANSRRPSAAPCSSTEIGELPLTLQVKILRFLQERTVERIGGRSPIAVDVRIIAATNRDLKVHLERGLFREDLYYRLSVLRVEVPPLRERAEDVVILANAFLARASKEQRRSVRFGPQAMQALMAHPWPGNVREAWRIA